MNLQAPQSDFDTGRRWLDRLLALRLTKQDWRWLLMVGGPLLVAVIAATLWIRGGRYVSTDNAYLHAPKLLVSTDVSGLVAEVDVREGQQVSKGEVLFKVDPTAFTIAVDNAKAQLAQTALNVQSMKADYQRLLGDTAAQQAQVQLAQITFDRAAVLAKTGATTAVAYDQARYALLAAQNLRNSLEQQGKVALAKLGGNGDIAVEQHPTYRQAKSQLDEAQRQLDHTIVRAPFDGVVTQVSQLQPGTFLVAATAGLTNTGAVALVGTGELWIDANFKETDLTWAKRGDLVEVTVDTYPGKTWTGKIESISPASGAEFSILPAQNASGNWVKVVQRIPVRVALDPSPSGSPLRAGMSANVTIDTRHHRKLSELW